MLNDENGRSCGVAPIPRTTDWKETRDLGLPPATTPCDNFFAEVVAKKTNRCLRMRVDFSVEVEGNLSLCLALSRSCPAQSMAPRSMSEMRIAR